MNKTVIPLIGRALLFFIVLNLFCKDSGSEYNGIYKYISGGCSSKKIELKKVKGFGDKYYLITIYRESRGKTIYREFLGVIKDNRLIIYAGRKIQSRDLKSVGEISLKANGIQVIVDARSCYYRRAGTYQ